MQHTLHMIHREHVSTGNQVLQAGKSSQPRGTIYQGMKKTGRKPCRVNLKMRDGAGNLLHRCRPGRHYHQRTAIQQRSPDFESCRVKVQGRKLQQARRPVKINIIGLAYQPDNAGMGNQNGLGLTGRARSEVHISRCGLRNDKRRILI